MRNSVALWAALVAACSGGNGGLSSPSSSLQITTQTSGQPGTDTYSITVDGGDSTAIGISATVTLMAEPGTHLVQLSGLPAGCNVADENPRTVTVTAGETTSLSFDVTCGAAAGSIDVTVQTTGSGPATYHLLLDGTSQGSVPANGRRTLSGIAAGTHAVSLAQVPPNCQPQPSNPQSIAVVSGASARVDFTVLCPTAGSSKIAFSSNARGLQAVFVVNPDGSGLMQLSPKGAFDVNPVWSPDGSRILFATERDLYVMNADGSSRTRLVAGEGIFGYRWSHDGSRIAYIAERVEGQDIFEDLWVMNADGSGQTKLASNATAPTWSADGLRIAFASDVVGDQQIHVINADGSSDTPITSPPMRAAQPAWSPDGTEIAFVSVPAHDILAIHPDGSGLDSLTVGPAQNDTPVWSPDGSRIAFTTGTADQPLESEVAVMNRDGSGVLPLTSHPGFDFSPDWSPDGSMIVFTRSDSTDSEVFVMNADGSGQTDVSNRPDALDGSPDWGGQPPGSVASRANRAALLWQWRSKRLIP